MTRSHFAEPLRTLVHDVSRHEETVVQLDDLTDDQLAAIGPKVPSSGSKDHGALFAELFARYGDFYKIDPLLFSPAEVTFVNLRTGRCHTFGRVEPGLLRKSFLGA